MDIPPEMPFLCSEEQCYAYSSALPVSSAPHATNNGNVMLSQPTITLPPLVMEPSEHHPWPSNTSMLPPGPTAGNSPDQMPQQQEQDVSTVNPSPPEQGKPKAVKSPSSASLPSHKTKWTTEEDDLLRSGLEMYGYGKWKLISAHVKTRNALQCKNHARHWVTCEKRSSNNKPTTTTANSKQWMLGNFSDHPPPPGNNDNHEPSVTMAPPSPQPNEHGAHVHQQQQFSAPVMTQPVVESSPSSVSTIQEQQQQQPHNGGANAPSHANTEQESSNSAQVQETFIDQGTITDHERKSNPEWFKPGSKASTPERYMKIRNHILDCWQAEKPQYVTKTAARRGLRDCGDVNAIGRVHAYLESIGAINVGCEHTRATRAPAKRGVRKSATRFYYYTDDEDDGESDNERSNKRRMMDDMDYHKPGAAEGVIRNGISSRRPKRVTKRPQHYLESSSNGADDNDPFRLVPVEHYHDNFPPPFEVEISTNALVVLEFHAHLAYTEIIGLMGGRFVKKDDGHYMLSVSCVFPCRGISTETQCEMDPESEMRAREVFAQKGLNVVGWYHSHPTFAPEPSVRDIEYQTLYQSLFRDEETGAEPFIGIIVSPFNEEYHIQFVHIAHKNSKKHVPYECIRAIVPADSITFEVCEQVQALIQEYKDYEHKWDLVAKADDHSPLDQLLNILTWYLPETQARTEFLEQVRQMVMSSFGAMKTENVVKQLAV